jgi:hypothetical protein
MASNRGYTTAAKVQTVFPASIRAALDTTTVESAINRIEGIIDTKLKVGSGVGANTITWATAKAPHWVIESAATYGAALQLCNPSIASFLTLDQLIGFQNLCSYMYKLSMDIIESEGWADFVVDQ